MKIIKISQEPGRDLQPGHLEDINRLSRTPLTADQVYVFPVRLCSFLKSCKNRKFRTYFTHLHKKGAAVSPASAIAYGLSYAAEAANVTGA